MPTDVKTLRISVIVRVCSGMYHLVEYHLIGVYHLTGSAIAEVIVGQAS